MGRNVYGRRRFHYPWLQQLTHSTLVKYSVVYELVECAHIVNVYVN